MSDDTAPALTPEQWTGEKLVVEMTEHIELATWTRHRIAEHCVVDVAPDGAIWVSDSGVGRYEQNVRVADPVALAAFLLRGYFTHEGVKTLRDLLRGDLDDLADRIERLLPPQTPQP